MKTISLPPPPPPPPPPRHLYVVSWRERWSAVIKVTLGYRVWWSRARGCAEWVAEAMEAINHVTNDTSAQV